ncbi:Eco57I restriction-modification methylase domain-containing protein [Profundibacterium mesophilum]|uniref:site-specific DNA-methyltransferase (adenine-specific) n=1 Tax=Profundibacterium mesophilum KAUST100406-0324 TaxID=1037889 RepID=A0A921TCA6_9RHOB|nr:Eco57I restriction-modification methylase domain-containing protein [Profundibacterium mesophilum]KAF0674896.1 putative Type II DNA modification methyltransferase [Profundibacterium mesophilum KAUST100406-0324]
MNRPLSIQPQFDGFCPVANAVERLAGASGLEERGAIYTKREVVDFILDLVGYEADKPLTSYRILEPSFGDGDFIHPIVDRLLAAAQGEPGGLTVKRLKPALRAVELHRATYMKHRASLAEKLQGVGLSGAEAEELVTAWLIQGDFLLCDFDHDFTHVVGNPPYIRQEVIPDILMTEYRLRYETIFDRADIYIPFIEKSLSALEQGGRLSFICADRWMKNRYGRKLREMVSRDYALSIYVDMVDTPAFHSEVTAYPAITVIERSNENRTRVFARPEIDRDALRSLSRDLTAQELSKNSIVREIRDVAAGTEPWVLSGFDELALVRRLEAKFPRLEAAGCKVGIGVATGADKAFIGDFEELDVEPSRKLPLVMTRDILTGEVQWQGRGVINPFDDDGKLVRLEEYPRLARYLEERRDVIAGRHVATKAPANWYRTIDRIHPAITDREKLLIPDIKGDAAIVYESGKLYPHHNLYFITSSTWDVRALQTVMKSGIARLFVSLYSTKMRGGFLRFQAQYLRRICLPSWDSVSEKLRTTLRALSEADDPVARNAAVAELYGLSSGDMRLVEGSAAA